MDLQLTHKTAIITGGTSGIGLAIAKVLYKEGAQVAITGRTQDKLNAAKIAIESDVGIAKESITLINVDVGTQFGCEELIKQMPSTDIFINNIGPYYENDFLNTNNDEELMQLFEVNVMSAVRLSKHYLKTMLQENLGRIIFMGSESSLAVYPNLIDYSIVKAGLLALKSGLAELTKNTCVTVNAVLPGPTMTEGVQEYFRDKNLEEETHKWFFNECNASLLQRWTQPEEVANLVAYLASPLASATNGASVRADGGILKIL